jgi:hypothetical protein
MSAYTAKMGFAMVICDGVRIPSLLIYWYFMFLSEECVGLVASVEWLFGREN